MMEIEIEKEQNQISYQSTSSLGDSDSELKNSSNENNFNMVLKCLLEQYSLEEVIESFFSSTVKYTKNKKDKKKFSELNCLIKKLNKIEGASKFLKSLIELPNNIKEKNEINNCKNNEENEIKKISMASTHEDENYIDVNMNEDNDHYSNNDNNMINLSKKTEVINILDDDFKRKKKSKNKNTDEIVIEIDDNYIEKEENNNNAIINLGKAKSLSSKYLDVIPIKKCNKKNELINTNKIYNIDNISYHCSIINGIYYKYKVELIDKLDSEVKFKCFNKRCKSFGIYDYTDKSFILKEPHWDGESIDCCRKLITEQDENNYFYMVDNNVNEIQMYSDED